MNNNKLLWVLIPLTFICSIILTAVGNMIEGWHGILVMLIGLTIQLLLLYIYNKKHK